MQQQDLKPGPIDPKFKVSRPSIYYWHHIPCILDSIFCRSLSCTACRAGGWLGGWLGRDGAGGGTVGVAVAGRGVVVPDEEADDALLGPGEDCTLVGL